MSGQYYTTTGYGIDVSNIAENSLNKDKFANFVKHLNLKNYEKYGINNDTSNEEIFLILRDNYKSPYSSDEGVFGVIADTISIFEGIELFYIEGNEIGAAIIFPAAYPWQYNETEKKLTNEYLDNMFKKYMTELGLDVVPDFQEVVSYG